MLNTAPIEVLEHSLQAVVKVEWGPSSLGVMTLDELAKEYELSLPNENRRPCMMPQCRPHE